MSVGARNAFGRIFRAVKDVYYCLGWYLSRRLHLVEKRKYPPKGRRRALKMLGFLNLCATVFGLMSQVSLTQGKSTGKFNRPGMQHGVNYNDGGKNLTDEQRLLRELMLGYDRNTRPVMNASHAVRVKLGLTLNQIFDLDERNQVLTTHIWLDQEWYDEKLTWEPDEFNNLKLLRIPCHLIWKPDIVLYNSADDYTDGYMPALAMVSHDGHVFWPPIVKLRSTCRIDITYFPFDDQTCQMKLGSWAYDGLQVDVLKRDKPIDLTNYVHNGEWELMNVKIVRNVEYYSCCPEPYPDVTFTLHIRRRTLYYTYNVIIPCIMLTSLTVLEFWMPPEGGEKVALGLTILLAFSVFMLLIAENMPATSFYIPLIGVYIITAMGLSCISVTCAVAISYIHHQGNMNRQVPAYMRKLADFLGRIVNLKRTVPPAGSGSGQSRGASSHLLSQQKLLSNGTILTTKAAAATETETPASSKNTSPSTSDTTCAPDCKTPLRESFSSVNFSFRSDADWLDFENVHALSRDPLHRADLKRSFKRRSEGRWSHTDEIIRKLDILLSRHEELLRTREQETTAHEWKEIAEIIDRTLFWTYTTITISLTVIILLLVPLGKTIKI